MRHCSCTHNLPMIKLQTSLSLGVKGKPPQLLNVKMTFVIFEWRTWGIWENIEEVYNYSASNLLFFTTQSCDHHQIKVACLYRPPGLISTKILTFRHLSLGGKYLSLKILLLTEQLKVVLQYRFCVQETVPFCVKNPERICLTIVLLNSRIN